MSKLLKYLKNPALVYLNATSRGLTKWVPDEVHLKLCYKARIGNWPDLDNPQTFNEKLQWLKLHDRNPLYTTLVDKCAVKEWVAERIGSEHVTKTYARWDRAEDIDISGLPERFVLKTNHDSGGIAICRDRETFDLDAAKKKLAKHLKRNYFWGKREWPYKNVKPCVFAEEYLEPNTPGDLHDYKLLRFNNGRIITHLSTDRLTDNEITKTLFDEEWHPLELVAGGHPRKLDAPAPAHFKRMKELADKLAGEFPFVRVDFYESGGRLLFGEMTFYPKSGFETFDPAEWDVEFGSWIELPDGGGWLLVSTDSLLWVHEDTGSATVPTDLIDYKFMCFGGRARCAFTCTGRAEGDLRVDFFDLDWNHLPFTRHYSNADVPPAAPARLKEMVTLSERLAVTIPFVRVDFYEIAGELYFGEMTLYPGSGMEEFDPDEWDSKLGSWIELPAGGGWLLVSTESLLWVHGETLLNGAVSDPNDYKIFCFDGEPRALYVATERASGDVKFDFFDLGWNHLPFVNGHQNADCEPARPRHLNEMLLCARTLSKGIPHVRVDFYEVGDKVYFGEMTFYHMSGLAPFEPEEWDLRLGSMLDLSCAFDCKSRSSEIPLKERLPL